MACVRWMLTMGLVLAGCSRANPAFGDDPADGSTGARPDSTTAPPDEGTTRGDPSADGTTSIDPVDTTDEPPAGTTGFEPGDSSTSGEPGEATGPEPIIVHLYQGTITDGGLAAEALASPDPAWQPCLAGAITFVGLCPDAQQTASLMRFEGSLADELVARGVPMDGVVLSPAGDHVAPSVDSMIANGPNQPLIDTPSVFKGEPTPFWTGGVQSTDPNCGGFTLSAAAMDLNDQGTLGSPVVDGPTWLTAGVVTCDTVAPILCLCW